MSSVLEELTYSNWEQLTSRVAKEIFQKGALVDWHYAGGIHFGLVSSISNTGKITVQKGSLPLEKITDNKGTGGTYGKFWYRANLDEFTAYTKEDLSHLGETSRTRFNPRCYRGDDWKERGYASPIEWTQIKGNRMLILSKPEITEDGLIMDEHYSP